MKKIFINFGLISLLLFLFSVNVIAAEFKDVKETDWFYDDLQSAVERGVINGYEDGTFRPDNFVTNAEFYKMLYETIDNRKTFNYYYKINEPDGTISYISGIVNDEGLFTFEKMLMDRCREVYDPSKSNGHWAHKYAYHLLKQGNNNIDLNKLDEKIKRKDVIFDIIKSCIGATSDFRRLGTIYEDLLTNEEEKYYNNFIIYAHRIGILKGYEDDTFRLENNITRAEVLALLERFNRLETIDVFQEEDYIERQSLEPVYIGEVDSEIIKENKSFLYKLPFYLVDKFVFDGWSLIATDEEVSEYSIDWPENVKYGFDLNNKKIILFINNSENSYLFDYDVFKEFGRYVYFEMLKDFDEDKLENMFNEGSEVKKLITLSGESKIDNLEDFFAVASKYYFEKFRKIENDGIPEIYKLVDKYFNNFIR